MNEGVGWGRRGGKERSQTTDVPFGACLSHKDRK